MTLQKDIFMQSEGDAWYRRNAAALAARDWAVDPVCAKLNQILVPGQDWRILEVGCGTGDRLHYLTQQHQCEVTGIDPSVQAVDSARQRGVAAEQGSADHLPYADASFDVLIFGFCLYLCDDGDLFAIAAEAHRVLKDRAWLLILDFDAAAPSYRAYHHKEGVFSRKMDYKGMFSWHPAYTLESLSKFHHQTQVWTDVPDEWVSLACMRKNMRAD